MTTDSVKARIYELLPDLLELKFGCELDRIFWYKSEADRKAGKIDWIETGHYQNGRCGTVVKDLRESDHLPMWIDYGDQLEFQIGPDDIVSYEILGSPIELPDVLRAIEKAEVEVELNVYGDTLLIGHYEKAGRNGYYSHDYWDLTKSYEGQSDEFKAFLKSILGV